jgi:hypothetical protein
MLEQVPDVAELTIRVKRYGKLDANLRFRSILICKQASRQLPKVM